MDWKQLAGPLTDTGLTLLGAAIGGPAGAVAATVGRQVASELGVTTPEQVMTTIRHNPDAVEKLHRLEQESAEQLALLAQEQRTFANILARDSDKGFFWDAWRPAMMWMLISLWIWSIVILPTLNAVLGTNIPMPPFEILFGVTSLFSMFYMGGNTAIRLFGKG